MTGRSSGGVPAPPGSTPFSQPPVTGPPMAGLPRAAEDENTAVYPQLEGADRLRSARLAVAGLATVSVGDLREVLALARAGRGGGVS